MMRMVSQFNNNNFKCPKCHLLNFEKNFNLPFLIFKNLKKLKLKNHL